MTWISRNGSRGSSRSSGPTCARSPTGCSARSARPTTPSRTPGCALGRADTSEVENLGGWLTTIVARVALNMLRARNTRREEPLDVRLPDPIIDPRRRHRPRARGAARRLGRPGAPGRARDADAGRAAGVRPARHVRRPVRGHRADRGPLAGGDASARQPRPPPRPRRRPGPRRRPDRPVGGRRGVPRRRPRRATSRRSSRCSTRTSSSGPTAAVTGLAAHPGCRDRRRSGACLVPRRPDRCAGRSSTAPPGWSPSARASRSRSGAVTIRNGRIAEIDFLTDPERLAQLDLTVLGDRPA